MTLVMQNLMNSLSDSKNTEMVKNIKNPVILLTLIIIFCKLLFVSFTVSSIYKINKYIKNEKKKNEKKNNKK